MSATQSLASVGIAVLVLGLSMRLAADVMPYGLSGLGPTIDAGAKIALLIGIAVLAVAFVTGIFGWLRRRARRARR